jgi:hypothetical protein
MSIGQDQDLLGELGIIMNFNDQTVTWNTKTISFKYIDAALYLVE